MGVLKNDKVDEKCSILYLFNEVSPGITYVQNIQYHMKATSKIQAVTFWALCGEGRLFVF